MTPDTPPTASASAPPMSARDVAIERVHQHIDASFERHLETVRDFLRQPSVSAEDWGMRETAQMVVEMIQAAGGESYLVEARRHPMVYGEINRGKPRTLLVYGMYDVQPVNGQPWRVAPFDAVREDVPGIGDAIVARGALNSKGPLGCLMMALKAIAEVDDFPCNLIFTIEGEEEIGSTSLPQFYRDNRQKLMQATAGVDFYFTQEANDVVEVGLGAKGMLHLALTSRGGHWCCPREDVHSSASPLIASPAWRLVQALACLKDRDETILVPGFMDSVIRPGPPDLELIKKYCARITREDFMQRYGANAFLGEDAGCTTEGLVERLLFHPTLNLAAMTAGEPETRGDKTIIPAEAHAYLDVRLVPEMEVEETVERIRRHLDEQSFEDIELTLYEGYSWSKVNPRDPIVQTLLDSYRYHGIEPLLIPSMPWSSPYYLFDRLLGLPYAIFGLGHGAGAHGPNEYCKVAGMRDFEKSVVTFLYHFAEQGNLGAPDYQI
jgi:acetylornithine deacetylase/succinyl-diaminopimelate desuccinylase-like protein